MSLAISEDTVPTMQRGLSDWWTEETEYVFQRIERWAAFARGYNRLRSQRYSHGCLTMTEEPVEPGWNTSGNKLIMENGTSWNQRSHNLQRSRRRKSRPEETRINCCGTFNYQSNNHLDSSCLETYSYDHSIYFKTIGDIRGNDRNRKCSLKRSESPMTDESSSEINNQEQVTWQPKTIGEIECHRCDDDLDDVDLGYNQVSDFGENYMGRKDEHRSNSIKTSQVWPIVDLTQLNLKSDKRICPVDSERYKNHTIIQITEDEEKNYNNNNNMNMNTTSDDNNNNNEKTNTDDRSDDENINRDIQRTKYSEKIRSIIQTEEHNALEKTDQSSPRKEQDRSARFSIRKTRQSPRKIIQPTIVGDNNVVWPSVLLNYKKNVDPAHSPHGHLPRN